MNSNIGIELLQVVKKQTVSGIMQWEKTGHATFEAKTKRQWFEIQILYPLASEDYNPEVESVTGAYMLKFRFQGGELAYFSGTKGERLIQEILGFVFEGWNKHLSNLNSNIESCIKELNSFN